MLRLERGGAGGEMGERFGGVGVKVDYLRADNRVGGSSGANATGKTTICAHTYVCKAYFHAAKGGYLVSMLGLWYGCGVRTGGGGTCGPSKLLNVRVSRFFFTCRSEV